MFLNAAFLVALGLGFIYQQSTNLYSHYMKPVRVTPSLRMDKEMVSKDIEGKVKIEEVINSYCSSLNDRAISNLADIILNESKKYGYDWELILAIIKTESEFDSRAVSSKGARGLMQVLPSTARWVSSQLGFKYQGLSSLYDPEYNIKLGTHYLHMMHQKFGNIEEAIAAYNRGPRGLRQYIYENKKFPSRYLEKVMACYRQLKTNSDKCAI